MYSINEVTVVTPAALVATALLSHQKRGMTRTSLLSACQDLLATLDVDGREDRPSAAHRRRAHPGRHDRRSGPLVPGRASHRLSRHRPRADLHDRFGTPNCARVLPEHDHPLLRTACSNRGRPARRHGSMGRHRAPQRPRPTAVAGLQARVHLPNRCHVRRNLRRCASRHGGGRRDRSSRWLLRRRQRARCGTGSNDTR